MITRNEKLGELSQLQKERRKIKYQIDSAAKSICILFEPMDAACDYTEKINIEQFDAYASSLREKKKQLVKIVADIERLKNETGEGDE